MVPDVLRMTFTPPPDIRTPGLTADPEEVPVIEIFPLPVVVEMAPDPPTILSPKEAVELGPPVPFNVMDPPPVVDMPVPTRILIPWQMLAVPVEEAVILIDPPVEVIVELIAKPCPPNPVPTMFVPVIFPALFKGATCLQPRPLGDPVQF